MSKRKCCFNTELQKLYCTFSVVEDNKHEALCNICNVKISIANKGSYDLKQHLLSKRHKTSIETSTSSYKINSFLIPKFTSIDYKILAVEGTLAFHSVKHHFSYKSTDCTTSLIAKIISDSEIAKKLSSARTKTECIVNNVIAPFIRKKIIDESQNILYLSVATDGSNHGATKLFPVLIQYFNIKIGIVTKILKLGNLKNETASTISKYLEDTLQISIT